jgi:hypothetical protein
VRRYPRLDDRGWLENEYAGKERTQRDIAAELGCRHPDLWCDSQGGNSARVVSGFLNQIASSSRCACGRVSPSWILARIFGVASRLGAVG